MTKGTARGAFALVVFAYIAVFLWFSPLQLQDYPNHLARALVLADLLFRRGAEFGPTFQFHFLFTPYVLGDLSLAALIQLTGVTAAAGLWVVLTFLSLPCVLFAYLRVRGTSAEVTALMLFISLYLSTDTIFMLGFVEFRLSIALLLGALALVEQLRQRWSSGRFAVFVVVVVLAYLTHLAAIAFIAAAVGASAAWRIALRKSRIDREALLLLPLICVFAWHFLGAAGYRQPDDLILEPTTWGSVASKVSRLSWDFVRYNRSQDAVVIATFAVFLLFCLSERRIWDKESFSAPQVLEPLGYGLVFVGLYVLLPFAQTEASYIDVRALALAPLFLVLGLLSLRPRLAAADSHLNAPAIWLAAAVACVNLGYLALHFRKESLWLAQYRAVIANIPRHGVVLPVYTERRTGNIREHLHAASFAVIDRAAITPYLFSGDRGSPMKYFRYTNRPYAPEEMWYPSGLDRDVDWQAVSQCYPYLLVLKPFTADRIPVKTHTIAENAVAALLAIE